MLCIDMIHTPSYFKHVYALHILWYHYRCIQKHTLKWILCMQYPRVTCLAVCSEMGICTKEIILIYSSFCQLHCEWLRISYSCNGIDSIHSREKSVIHILPQSLLSVLVSSTHASIFRFEEKCLGHKST